MSRFKRIAATGLVVSMTLSISVCAAAPTVTYDESYYVNLDYYGATRTSNIVKSFSLNGQNSFTDYGTYDSIKNMSNYIEPTPTDGGVTFSFGDNIPSRFYFEAKSEQPLGSLPWKVEIGYKLNGVPIDPANLAGAKGLVEIDLNLIPNKDAPEYFRNNMVLTAAAALDYDKIYSVEAPGAQIQTVGNYKALAFMALPGEECHFVTRLGSDNFEFSGFTFLMVPATLSQMDKIKDVREAKETLEDSANAINKSLDVILNTMNSLSGSLNATADGLAALDQARQVISEGKGQIYTNFDQSMLDLGNISTAMKPTEGDIKAAKDTLSQVNQDLSHINSISKSLKTNIASTTKVLKGLKTDTGNMRDYLDDFKAKIGGMTITLDSLSSSLNALNSQLSNVTNVGETAINAQMVELSAGKRLSVKEIRDILSLMSNLSYTYLNMPAPKPPTFQEYVAIALSKTPYKGMEKEFCQIWDKRDEIQKELAPVSTISGGVSNVASATAIVVSQTSSLVRSMSKMYDDLDSDYKGLGDSLLADGEKLSDEGVKALEKINSMIGQLDALYDTLNTYEPKAQETLDHVVTLSNALTNGTINLQTLMVSSEALLKQSGTFLDAGTAKTLNGAIDSLRRTTKGLNQTGTIKSAKDTVKHTIDDKWDEYTGEDSNLLLMDTSLAKPSLTSSRNASPETIQILMRTDEISVKDQTEKANVDETYVAKGNVFSRIGSIFQAIGDAVKGVFS